MPTRGAVKAVAKVLSDPQNAELTAEEVAEKAIEAYEEAQASTHNLIVLGHFRLEDDRSYVAAVGPLSTRAVMRAKEVGERFAWDYKTRKGTGKYTLVPLIRDPNRAWDDVRADQVRAVAATSALRGALSLDPYAPGCICGLPSHPRYNSLGDLADMVCPRHPEGRGNGGEEPASAG